MQIPQDIIETIRDRVDIVDVVSQYVDLRRTGSSFKGLCPFHDEKTPSFTVSQDKQFYHCFGCEAHGTAIGFLMEYEHMDGVSFPEAVRALGKRVGVEVPDRPDPGAEQRRDRNAAVYRTNAFAARFYHRELVESPGVSSISIC